MRCSHCGFVSNKDFYVCPYCGETYQPDNNVLRKIIDIGGIFSISVRALIYILVLNALGIILLVDWYLGFRLALILWASIIAAGIITFVSIKSYKPNPITSLEKIIFFLFVVLILCIPLCRIFTLGDSYHEVFNLTYYFPTFVIPLYIIGAIAASIIVFLTKGRTQKIRPLWTEALILLFLVVSTLNFIFLLVNKFNGVPFKAFDTLKAASEVAYGFAEVLVFLSFGVSLVFAINYNIIITGHIVRKVKSAYGKRPD